MKITAKLLFVVMSCVLFGCGGGTSGTSPTGDGTLNKVFSGVVTDQTGTPQAGVVVTVDSSKERATTDAQGRFSLGADLSTDTALLRFRSGGRTHKIAVTNLGLETSAVGLQVQLGGEALLRSSYELALLGIDGENCKGLFAEARVVRFVGSTSPLVVINQSALPAQTVSCTARIRISENGVVRAGVEFQLLFASYSSADSGSLQTLQPLEQGVTDEIGTGNLSFTLTREHSAGEFFVIEAPLNFSGGERVSVVISLLNNEVQ